MKILDAAVHAVLAAACAVASAQMPVTTESGKLIGQESTGVRTFLGVPFAAPPVGKLRWTPPQPVVRSVAALPANHLGASCMQKLGHSRAPWTESMMVQNEISEDCLYLNIWAAARTTAPQPVLVYVHGGAFTEGSGGVAIYDGAALAKRGLIVVDINYRLGVFGFLTTNGLADESSHKSAGNYGLLDQIAALQWVQRNIAAFGGDPHRVTVAGQSAGASSVIDLMASPLSNGLFQRAIVNSGPNIGNPTPPASAPNPLQVAAAVGDTWAKQHGGTPAALRALPAEALLELQDVPPQARRPVVDGWVLPASPDADLLQPKGPDVPVLAGWVADEGSSSPTYGKMPATDFHADAVKKYGTASTRFLQLYPAGTDAEAGQSQVDAARDRNFAAAALWAQTRSAHRKSPVYLYYFDRVPPWKAHPEYRAHHTSEVPYFFATLDKASDRDYTATDRAVSRTASQAWIDLAATGAPGFAWKPAADVHGPFTVIGDMLSTQPELSDDKAAFWRQVLLGSGS